MFKRIPTFALILFACAMAPALSAPTAVPSELAGWEAWVLKGQEYRRCPMMGVTDAADADAFRCMWPERLAIEVNARGGSFTQRWQVFAEGWITLPGDLEHWPRDVRSNGAPLAVVARDDLPQARLAPGTYSISGRFEWAERPEALTIAAETALVDLTIDGQRVAQPERPEGNLWLGKRRTVSEANGLEVQVYRLVRDEIPVELTTLVRLQVAGEGREELLARALPEGFTPTRIASELPARLETDGRLRVQVRPGSYDITLVARGASVATTLKRPVVAPAGATWTHEEVWSFAGDDRLRVAAAEGPESMDPKQADVPPDWQGLPAYRMTADATLTVNERSRGLGAGDDNRLQLSRKLWLDFNHQGFTAVDSINGSLRRDWRLDMAAPFTLASVRSGGENLLVTNTPGADAKDGTRTGVELRTPTVQLTTIARGSASSGAVPASGWTTRFDAVQGQLFLPPGHRLLAAIGPDSAPGTWWSRWTLWNIFGLCIVVAVTYRIAGRVVAAIALAGLALMYQESPDIIWLWANLLAAIAIARAVPEGRLRRVAGGYRTLSTVVLGLALLPTLWAQVRYALYPQLENSPLYEFLLPEKRGNFVQASPVEEYREVNAPPPPPMLQVPQSLPAPAAEAAAAPAMEDLSAGIVRRNASVNYLKRGLNAAQVVQRYAPGTQLQTGPGIPSWNYNTYRYSWSGPVEPGDDVHFIYIGPLLLALWRLLGVVALAAWFITLLQKSFGWQLRTPWQGGRVVASLLPLISCGLLSALALVASPSAGAASAADADAALLNELQSRLIAAPE